MKPQATAPLPPKLWMTRQLARETLAWIYSWRPATSLGFAGSKTLGIAAVFLKKAAIFVLAGLAAIIVPCFVLAGAHSVALAMTGSTAGFAVDFRPIDISLVHAERWSSASSSDASPEWRHAMDSEWNEAVEQARKTRSKVAMIDNGTVKHLLNGLSTSGAKRSDIMVGALVEALSAGANDAQAMDQARQALALSKRSADPMSLFATEFGPIQTCRGFDLALTVLPLATTPPGPCTAVLDSTKFGLYTVSFFLSVLLMIMTYMTGLMAQSLRRSLAKRFEQWSQRHSARLMVDWESQQMSKAANAPPAAAPTRRPRL